MLLTARQFAILKAARDHGPLLAKKKKIPATRSALDGYTFDSKVERDRYVELKLLAQAKTILNLEVHPIYPLEINGVKIGRYTPDFTYLERRRAGDYPPYVRVVEDVKSVFTAKDRTYRRMLKLMLAIHKIAVRTVIR